ncbi:MAG: phosphoribosyl-AMP cyclohydrolase, partial [Gammaproteobacteria bacterium]
MSWLDDVKWNEQGLVPAIAQDARSGQVLTLAWMNRTALETSLREGR